jgi:hypothetical protein
MAWIELSTLNHRHSTSQLPTRVTHSRNQTLIGQLAEANAADAELAINGSRPAAQPATTLAPRAELGRLLRLGDF